MSPTKHAWPHCPKCRRDLWQGWVGAPVKVVQGCVHCQLMFVDGEMVVRLDDIAADVIEELRAKGQ